MKIAVMRAGPVGCYYGSRLARAGYDVALIGRHRHVEAVERRGLRLETKTSDEHIPVSATTVRGALWAITNCAWNALSGITQLPHGRFAKGEGATAVLLNLVDDGLSVRRGETVGVATPVNQALHAIVKLIESK